LSSRGADGLNETVGGPIARLRFECLRRIGDDRMTAASTNWRVNHMAKPMKFAHVVYQTRRFDEMLAWYQEVFEARVVYQNPVFAFLTYDDEHHRFAFANMSAIKPDGLRPESVPTPVSIMWPTLTRTWETFSTLMRA
jgi:catechol-2,3-dioxygenase